MASKRDLDSERPSMPRMFPSRWTCDDFGRSGPSIQRHNPTRTRTTGRETKRRSDHSQTDRTPNIVCDEETRKAWILQTTTESDGELVNRQARIEGAPWESYGNVTFFEALKRHAIALSFCRGLGIWVIECRCESEPETIDTFEVQTTIHAEILNPRKGS